MSAPTLSFVLPAHNEVRNVAGMAARLGEIARPFGEHEIIFVDDGSTDGTLTAILRSRPAIRRSVTSPSPAISGIRRRCVRACATRAAAP